MGKDDRREDDDGRIVADMTFLEDRPLTGIKVPGSDSAPKPMEAGDSSYPTDLPDLGKEGRGAAFRGALGATLLIGGVYIVAAAVLIGILIFIWK